MKKIRRKKPKEIDIHEVLRDVSRNMEKNANVKTVFGDPIKFEGRTIIPVATVTVSGRDNEKINVESKPVGYIEMTKAGAKFVPTMDMSGIALKGLISGVVAVGMLGLSSLVRAFRKRG
jgi:hypothetical protein